MVWKDFLIVPFLGLVIFNALNECCEINSFWDDEGAFRVHLVHFLFLMCFSCFVKP